MSSTGGESGHRNQEYQANGVRLRWLINLIG